MSLLPQGQYALDNILWEVLDDKVLSGGVVAQLCPRVSVFGLWRRMRMLYKTRVSVFGQSMAVYLACGGEYI